MPPSKLTEAIDSILHVTGAISRFKLTKLLYLADLASVTNTGRGITGCVYLRQEDGPWPPMLTAAIAALEEDGLLLQTRRKGTLVLTMARTEATEHLAESDIDFIAQIVGRYGQLSDFQLKTTTYRTQPMRQLLRAEKKGEATNNRVVLDAR